jgi:hypothetical protein
MNLARRVSIIILVLISPVVCKASIQEVGDLNIIVDVSNPSNGLRFLDMSYSDGLGKAAALAAAQNVYANARLATAAEFDDLFAAAGVVYQTGRTASDSFLVGGDISIVSGTSSTTEPTDLLINLLGPTNISGGAYELIIWTDPDGNDSTSTTRDYLTIHGKSSASNYNSGAGQSTVSAASGASYAGWLIVSDAAMATVPEATSVIAWMILGSVFGFLKLARRFR